MTQLQSPDPRSLLRWLESRRDGMIAEIRELVELESPSSDKQAVDRLGRVLATQFEALSGKAHFHRAANFGDHLQVDFAGARRGKPVMLLGHYGTVYDVGTLRRMPFRVAPRRFSWPGTHNM